MAEGESVGMKRRVMLLIAGMHRSGTSAFAGTLAHLGVAPPKRLIPPSANNPRGYWESPRFRDFHEEVLRAYGRSWDDLFALPTDWALRPQSEALRGQLRLIFDEEFGDNPLVLVKDPRICRLLPLWRRTFEDDFDLRVVMPFRNPLEVAASLMRRNAFPVEFGVILWMRHVLGAERDSRGVPRAFVSYEDLLSDWRGTIERTFTTLQLGAPEVSDLTSSEISAFLLEEYRHERADLGALRATQTMPEGVRACYECLLQAAKDVEPGALISTFDEVRRQMDDGCEAFGATMSALKEQCVTCASACRTAAVEASKKVNGLEAENSSLRKSVATLEGRLEESLQSEKKLAKELEKVRFTTVPLEELADVRQAKVKAEDLLLVAQSERDLLKASVKDRFLELAVLQRMIRAQDAELKRSERLREQACRDLERTKDTLSFRLGYALIHSTKSWSDFAALPRTVRDLRIKANELAERRKSAHRTGASDENGSTRVRGRLTGSGSRKPRR